MLIGTLMKHRKVKNQLEYELNNKLEIDGLLELAEN